MIEQYNIDVDLAYCVNCEKYGGFVDGVAVPYNFTGCEKCQEYYCCDGCRGDYNPSKDPKSNLCFRCRN